MDDKRLSEAIEGLVKKGLVEVLVDEDGSFSYRASEKGLLYTEFEKIGDKLITREKDIIIFECLLESILHS